MKTKITKVEFKKEQEGKFGKQYVFQVCYDDKKAYHYAKKKDQTDFIEGQEAEFIEEEKTSTKDGSKYIIVKLPPKNKQSNFGKALTKEQSRYSGFADSYTKDLLVAKILRVEEKEEDSNYNDIVMDTLKKRGREIFEHLVEMDKTLEQ